MNKFIFILITMLVSSAFAKTDLACWNMFSAKGSRPIMTANVLSGNRLSDVTFDLKNNYFELYFLDKVEDSGEDWGHKNKYTKSKLENPTETLSPELITKNVYKNNNAYDFIFGKYSFRSPYYNNQGKYEVRLILPTDLSKEFLKTFRIRNPSERSNAVMIIPSAYESHQDGKNYLRMYCTSTID